MSRRPAIPIVLGILLATMTGPALAQDVEFESIVMGGRVEIPDVGYAITVPGDWVAVRPTAEDAGAIGSALREIDAEMAANLETALASGVGFSFLAFGELDPERAFQESCNVIDYPSEGASIEMAAAADVASLKAMGDRLAGGPELTMLELPAGPSARLDYSLQFPGFVTVHSAYYFTDGGLFHLLTCTHMERPADAWLPIAESFEYLPKG